MFYINKNSSLNQLQELVKKSLQIEVEYLPDTFIKQQQMALEIFKKRAFLEEVIEKSIEFNKKIIWEKSHKNLFLISTAEELIEVFKLRSDVYTKLNYNNEFPEIIEGLNFDNYDFNSAIIYTKINNEITGTCRLIFDSEKKLPIEQKLDMSYLKNKYSKIGEVSRLTVKHKKEGLNLEFKNLTKGIYLILKNNPIEATISVISKEHFKLYSKFGGFEIEKELNTYGYLDSTFVITSWDPSKITNFFKKAFLS